jgi:hypothetical protein
MNQKYIAKLSDGQWRVFFRTGNAKSHIDVLCADEYSGTLHTACAIVRQLNANLSFAKPQRVLCQNFRGV